ncbi:MAG: polysaccharide pyruvyl transferase family protein, partial [Panacagrimonas sp.]
LAAATGASWSTRMPGSPSAMSPIGGPCSRSAAPRRGARRGPRRGPALREQGHPIGDIALGDPGILVDQLAPVAAASAAAPRYRAGLVLHHSLNRSALWRRYAGSAEIRLIDVIDNTLKPLVELAECEVVIAQSLHGLIFAEALGKPALWVSTVDDPGWCFKFEDWFSTTAEPQARPRILEETSSVERWIGEARRSHSTIDKAALLAAFPLSEACRIAAPFVPGFEACRQLPPARIACEHLLPWATRAKREFQQSADAQRIRGAVQQLVTACFSRQAEPRYALLAPPDCTIEEASLRELEHFMDRHPRFGFLFVDAAVAHSPAGGRVASLPTMDVWQGDGRVHPAIFLRPEATFDPGKPHATASRRAA